MSLPIPESQHLQPADLLTLYNHAQVMSGEELADFLFRWLHEGLRFDQAAIISSYPDRAAWLDAHFHGYSDPAAMLASFGPVAHLDPLSPQMLTNPMQAMRQDVDDPRVAGDALLPFREHLHRWGILYSACIAVPGHRTTLTTVCILTRRTEGDRFSDADLANLQSMAPHVAACLSICRNLALAKLPRALLGDLPVALIDAKGHFLQTSTAFVREFWNDEAPQSNVLDSACFAAIRAGEVWPLPDGQRVVQAVPDGDKWLLRVRTASPLDKLTSRERVVAQLFAKGKSRKEIAQLLGMSPSTAKNHLAHIYEKLALKGRAELVAACDPSI